MKNTLILTIGAVVIASCATPPSRNFQGDTSKRTASVPPKEPLFLHLLASRYFTNPPNPAHRIVTVRVYPFQDFAVFAGDPEDLATNRWVGAWTNARLGNNGSPEVRPLAPIWDSGNAVLAGRIERRNGAYFAHLQGRSHTTLNYFHGEIELEKPVYEQGGMYQADGIWGAWFVLSTNADCDHFVRAADEGNLHRHVVNWQDPIREHWERREPDRAPQIPSAEPRAAPNAAPPHR